MLDHHDGVAVLAQALQHREQHLDVLEVQPGGGLVEDVQGAPGVAARQLEGELHALRLAARQRGGALPEADVAQAHVGQGLQLARDGGDRGEERQGLLHRHPQHLVDRPPLVADLQGLAVVAAAVADVAGHVHVGQEVHLDLDQAVALAGLAAPAAHVEGEAPRAVAARARLGHAGEELADRCQQAGVGRRVGARGASDRRLVDVDQLVEVLQALDRLVRRGLGRGAVEPVRRGARQGVVDQCRLT